MRVRERGSPPRLRRMPLCLLDVVPDDPLYTEQRRSSWLGLTPDVMIGTVVANGRVGNFMGVSEDELVEGCSEYGDTMPLEVVT